MPLTRSSDCPSEEEWFAVAAGLAGGREAALVDHASRCGYCAPLLRAAIEDMREEITPEEAATLERMRPPVRPFPAHVTPFPPPRARGPFRRIAPWGAAAAVLVAGMAGFFAWRKASEPDPSALGAQAYAAMRTTEFRLAGVPHAPRYSGQMSSRRKPPEFREAAGAIWGAARQHPSDPAWLQAKGRSLLLEGTEDPSEIIASLESARDYAPIDSALRDSILIDLAAAKYGQNALDGAYEILSEVLERRKQDPVVLFNRGLVAKAGNQNRQAVEDFEAFLKLEPSGPWADEARKHLKEVKDRLGRMLGEPSPSPAEFLAVAAAGQAEPERYLDIALIHWLPAAGEPVSRRALDKLAELLQARHGDPWLAVVLSHPISEQFLEASRELSAAVSGVAKARFQDVEPRARSAITRFERAGNGPAALRARVELVSLLSRTFQNGPCVEESSVLPRELESRNYTWLLAQTLLEHGMCAQRERNLEAGRRDPERALELAKGARYRMLTARAQYVRMGLAFGAGDLDKARTIGASALHSLWEGNPAPERAFSFYSDLARIAERDGLPRLEESLVREAIAMVELGPQRLREGVSRYHLALILARRGETKEAGEQFEKGRRMLDDVASGEKSAAFLRETELRIAEFDVAMARWREANERLSRIEFGKRPQLSAAIRYGRALGKAKSGLGDFEGARSAYWDVIETARDAQKSSSAERDREIWQRSADPVYRDMASLLLTRGDTAGAARLWQWHRFSPYDGLGAAISRSDLDKPLPMIEGAVSLSFFALPDKLGIWFASGDGADFRWSQVSTAVAEETARRFARQCADPASPLPALREDARKLHEWLIQPFEDKIPAGMPLIVETDGWVSRVPFAALEDRGGNALPNPVTYSPGLWMADRLAARGADFRPEASLVVHDPALGEKARARFPRPVHSEEWAAQLPGTHLTGADSNVEKTLKAMSGAEAMFIVGHGVPNGGQGGIVVGPSIGEDPDLLDARRIEGTLLPACRLVVLVACGTSVGEQKGPANPDSLVRVFHRAAVPNVVASMWNVDDKATAESMKLFQTELFDRKATGSRISGALRKAAEGIRRKYPHPYYWAAFAVFGRG